MLFRIARDSCMGVRGHLRLLSEGWPSSTMRLPISESEPGKKDTRGNRLLEDLGHHRQLPVHLVGLFPYPRS